MSKITSKKIVYAIDDDTLYLYGIKRLLSKNLPDIELATFNNGQAAITAMRGRIDREESLPDIILLDLNMPKMNGWEFLSSFEELKKTTNKEIQVFVITSQADSESMRVNQVEWDDTVKEFIQKPVKAEAILELLK